jgi:hypothetical protein
MPVTIPGLTLSILRQSTSTQTGKPVLISGRFTAFGLGCPALVRVTLEGPDYNPERTTFDAFASPFTGDYNVQVVPPKDGNYKIYADAYPLPPLPQGPSFPTNLLLLPPVAESEQPPLVVGLPAPGGVSAQLPSGSQFLSSPPQNPLELQVAVGAPSVSISMPSGGGGGGIFPTIFPIPSVPTPSLPTPAAAQAQVSASIDGISVIPDTISAGQVGTGYVSWRNIGAEIAGFTLQIYLMSSSGGQYGPVQTLADVRGVPGIINTTPLALNTVGINTDIYDVKVDILNPTTGQLVNTRTFSRALTVTTPGAPLPTPTPPVPTIPTPSVPGVPKFKVGDLVSVISNPDWGTGTVALVIPPVTTGGTYSYGVQFAAGYATFLETDLQLATGIPKPALPSAPTVSFPSIPTPDMINPSAISNTLPQQLNVGDTWSGHVQVPTIVPSLPGVTGLPGTSLPTLPGAPTLPGPTTIQAPNYTFDLEIDLQSPSGKMITAARSSNPIQLGNPLDIGANFNTSGLESGRYNVFLNIASSGNRLFNQIIGVLYLVPLPSVPTVPTGLPTVATPEMFKTPTMNLPTQVTQGDIWSGSVAIPTQWPSGIPMPPTLPTLPVQAGLSLETPDGQQLPVTTANPSFQPGQPITLPVSFDTSKLPGPGTDNIILTLKDLAGNSLLPSGVPAMVLGMLRVLAAAVPTPPPPPILPTPTMPLGPSVIKSLQVAMSQRNVNYGDTVEIPVIYQHSGKSSSFTIYAAIGKYPATFGNYFDEILVGQKTVQAPDDPSTTGHLEYVPIQITRSISAGTYAAYAKTVGVTPPIISNYATGVIRVLPAVAPVTPTVRAEISPVTAAPRQINLGEMVIVRATVTNTGNQPIDPMVYFYFYKAAIFTQFLGKSGGATAHLEPGQSFEFSAARIESVSSYSYDVGCGVEVGGKEIATRRDGDVYRGPG